ncbi:hypothetical protein ACFYZI_22315 [Streptomyces griseorubiginosus]|uniref:hypothetical protein n=1 Tax=Streptomyces griseorubiginosus TaxID=67304 RepID=UPI00369AFA5B
MEPADADAYFGKVLRNSPSGTRLARSQALTTYFVFLELRHPHLLINKFTALGNGPVSAVSLTAPLRGQAAMLEQLRVDRQLEEALSHGPDPLHLAEVFGLDAKTAIRYPDSARALLEQAAEQQLR